MTARQMRSRSHVASGLAMLAHGAQDGMWILMLNAGEWDERWIPDLSVID